MNNIIVCIIIIISILLVYFVKLNYKKENFKNTILNEENKKYITKEKFNEHITELLNNLNKKFKEKIIEINTITEDNILDKLPKGTILSWNNDNLPTGWKWCDGSENMIPDFNNKFPLGGKKEHSEDAQSVYNRMDGKIKPGHLFFIDKNNNKIKDNFIPQHTHKFTNFPSLAHNHTTDNKSHTHSGYFYTHNNNFRTQLIYEGDHVAKGANFFGLKKGSDNSSTGGSHTHTVNKYTYPPVKSINGKEIDKNISGNPIIEDTGEPFYPRSKYINFIIKVV